MKRSQHGIDWLMDRFTRSVSLLAILATFVFGGLLFSQPLSARADVSRLLPFIAHLRTVANHQAVPDGEYRITFAIYNQETGGTPLWQETQNTQVTSGEIDLSLGTQVPFPSTLTFDGGPYYLGVTVGSDQEMSPRRQIGSVPMSLNSGTVGGASPGTGAGNVLLLDSAGNIAIQGGATFGGTILPGKDGINLGSSTNHFASLYVDTLSVTNATINGTEGQSFSINTAQQTDNLDLSSVRFYLGAPQSSYAALQWNGPANRFDLLANISNQTYADLKLGSSILTGNAVLTLPTSSDVLVGRTTTDTLTNKTLQAATVTTSLTGAGTPNLAGFGTYNGQTLTPAGSSFTGTVEAANTLTVHNGGIMVTGNSVITGTLGGLTGLTVASGGANISGDLTVTGNIVPGGVNNTVGTASAKYENGYFQNLTVDNLTTNSTSSNFTAPLSVTTTTQPQLVISYDASNFASLGVSSSGQTTIDATGAAAGFVFGKPVTANTLQSSSATITGGSINGAPIGASSRASGAFTSLAANSGLSVTAGGAAITGNTTITGNLTGLTGLTVASGGETITSGNLAVSSGNITASGTVNGATISGGSLTGGAVSGGSLSATAVNGLSVAAGVVSAGTWQGAAVGVQYGGTGSTSFTSNGLLYGNGSSALQVTAAGTPGQLLVSNASGVPTFVSLSGDASLSSSGSLTLSPSGVGTGGTYGSSTAVPQLTVDSKGRITAVGEVSLGGLQAGSSAGGDLSGTYPNPTVVKVNGAALGSTVTTAGTLLLGTGSAIASTVLSGDATLAGDGKLTIADNSITSAKILNGTILPADLSSGDYSSQITSGTYSINVTGNAGTVTNGLYSNTANTITAPTGSSVALTVKPATSGTAHVLDVYDNAGTPAIASYFDASGLFHGSGVGIANGTIATGALATSTLTVTAGTGLSGGGSVALGGSVTLNNAGVTGLVGTANQVNVSGATGSVTLSLPQSIATSSTPTFAGLTSSGGISVTGTANVGALVSTGAVSGSSLAVTNGVSGGSLTVTGTSSLQGDLTVGTNASNTLTLNAVLGSSLVPSADNTYNLGSASNSFASAYIHDLHVVNQDITNINVQNDAAADFIINSNNATADTENSTLQFSRGTVSPNAIIKWDATNQRFDLNQNILAHGSTILGDASADSTTIRGVLQLEDSTSTSQLLFGNGTDTGLYRSGSAQLASTADLVLNPQGAATSGTQTYGSRSLILEGSYWNGSAATTVSGGIQLLTTATSPTYGLSLQTNGSTRLYIDQSGQVGIGTGTTTLTHQLEVSGALAVSGSSSLNGINNNAGGISNAGAISGATTLTATGSIQGGTLTDGTATLNAGALAGVTTITTTGAINGQTISSAANFTGTLDTAGKVTVAAGGIAVTGNSTIAGTLGGLTGLTVASGGASIGGNLTASGTVNGANISGGTLSAGSVSGGTLSGSSLSSTALIFSGASGAISTGTTDANLGIDANGTGTLTFAANSSGNIIFGTGASGTGCTIDRALGNLSCSGTVSAANVASYWSRVGSALQPSTSGDAITTSGNISTTGSGTLTSAGALTVSSGGASITGGLTVLTGGITATGQNLGLGTGTITSGAINGQTISGTASFTGTVTSSGALTVSSGGASVTGGINNNAGGITNAGAIAGASTLVATGSIQGGSLTDGTASMNSGALTGATTGSFGTSITSPVLYGTGNLTVSSSSTNSGTLYLNGASDYIDTNSQVLLTATPQTTSSSSLLQLGAALASGSAGGTYLGSNTASNFAGNLAEFQVGGASRLKLDAAGNLTVSGNILPGGSGTLGTTGSRFAGAYLSNLDVTNLTVGGTSASFTSPITVTTTTSPQLTLAYDGSNNATVSVDGSGVVTFSGTTGSTYLFSKQVTANSLHSSGAVITGSSIDATTVGATTRSSGAFTSLAANAGLTVSSGGAAITGNSTITGTLTGITGLTVASGGATVTSGNLAVSSGNITASGTINTATISGGTLSGGTYSGTALTPTGNYTAGSASYSFTLQGSSNYVLGAAPASSNYGLLSVGASAALFDGSTQYHFVGHAQGTELAVNAANNFSGNLVDLQVGGTSVFTVSSTGALVAQGGVSGPSTGSFGYWSRSGTTLQPTTAGDAITTSGAISTTSGAAITASGLLTASTTGATALAVTGAPTNSATSSLIQIGGAIASGNNATNGGTYIGLNQPSSGAGSAADAINIQKNGVSQLKLDNAGNLTVATSLTDPTHYGSSTAAGTLTLKGSSNAGTNAQQTITATNASANATITVSPTYLGPGGTITVTPSDTAASIQSKLAAIPAIGSTSNVGVSGSTSSSGSLYTGYVAVKDSNVVYPVSSLTGTPVVGASIAVGNGPTMVRTTPDGGTIVVYNSTDASLSVINPTTNTVTRTVASVGASAVDIAISTDSSTAYVLTATNYIGVTLSNGNKTATLGSFSAAVAMVTKDGTNGYVADGTNLYPVTLATGVKGTAIAFAGGGITRMAITPDASKIYVVYLDAGGPPYYWVEPVTTSNNTKVTAANTQLGVTGSVGITEMRVSPDGSKVYMLNTPGHTFIPITVSSNAVGSAITLAVSAGYFGMAFTGDGSTAFALYATSSTLIVPVTVSSGAVGSTTTVAASGTSGGGMSIVTAGTMYSGTFTVTFQGQLTGMPITALSTASTGWAAASTVTGAIGNGNIILNAPLTTIDAYGQLDLASYPLASATSSVLQLGGAIAGGSANGTYLGGNAPTGFSGNLVDLQLNGNSKFKVTSAGALTTASTITSGAINGQTISSAASLTGTLTVATGLTVSAGGANLTSGGITNAGAIAGATTIAANNTLTLSGTGANELAVTGTPLTSSGGTSSLVQLGSAIASGSASGNYLGINTGSSFAGNLLEMEKNGTQLLSLDSNSKLSLTHAAPTGTDWVQSNTTFSSNDVGIANMTTFQGKIYTATNNSNVSEGTKMYSSSDGSTWSQVYTTGFGTPNNTQAYLFVANNVLYALTRNATDGAQIWRSPDGSTWSQIGVSGLGQGTNNVLGFGLTAFNGALYLGTSTAANGGNIYRSVDNGLTWSLLPNFSPGFGIPANTATIFMGVYNGYLYVGTNNASGAQLWRTADGANWTQVGGGTFLSTDTAIRSPIVYKGALYVSSVAASSTTGGNIYRSYDGTTWTKVNTYGGFGSSSNTATTTAITQLYVFNGALYATSSTTAGTGALVYRSTDGTTWSAVNSAGFGSVNNTAVSYMTSLKGILVVGTSNSGGGQIWTLQTGMFSSTSGAVVVQGGQIGNVQINDSTVTGIGDLQASSLTAIDGGFQNLSVATALAGSGSLTVKSASSAAVNEVETITAASAPAGSTSLQLVVPRTALGVGATVNIDPSTDNASTIQTKIAGVTGVGSGNVSVTGSGFTLASPALDHYSTMYFGGGVPSFNLSVIVGSGSNRYLVVAVTTPNGAPTASGVTYKGTSMTLLYTSTGANVNTAFYGLKNPATDSSSNNITVTSVSTFGGGSVAAEAVSLTSIYQGAASADSLDAGYSNTGTGNLTTTGSVLANTVLIDAFGVLGSPPATLTKNAAQSALDTPSGNVPLSIGYSYKMVAGAGSASMSWTSSVSNNSGLGFISLKGLSNYSGSVTATFQGALAGARVQMSTSSTGWTVAETTAGTTGQGNIYLNGSSAYVDANSELIVAARPQASTTASLLQLGNAIASGNVAGTYFGLNANSGYGGNLADLQVNGTSEFKVDASGNLTIAGNLTTASTGTNGFWSRSGTIIQPGTAGDAITTSGNISTSGSGTITSAGALTVSSGGAAITGNSTITGTLGGLTGLTVASGGATITSGGLTVTAGGINANSSGITNAGSIAGVTTLAASSTLTLSGTGANELAVTGAPSAATNASLIQFGAAITGGSANGTYLGLNAAAGFNGNLADLQNNGSRVLRVSATGNSRLTAWNFYSVLQTTTAEGAFTDVTSSANSSTNWNIFKNAAVTNDRTYFGFDSSSFTAINFLKNAGAGGTITWEYWNGSSWAAISGGSDATSGLTASGQVSWTNSMTSKAVDGVTAYWLRATVTGDMGTQANGTVFLSNPGGTTNVAWLVQPSSAAAATWSSNGVLLGANAAPGFAGNLVELKVGGTTVFKVDASGNLTTSGSVTVSKAIVSGFVPVTSTATPTFDASQGNTFQMTLTASVTSSTISNPTTGEKITLILVQDTTGGWTMTWPGNVKLAGGTFVLTATPDKTDTITFVYDGTNWIETARSTNL